MIALPPSHPTLSLWEQWALLMCTFRPFPPSFEASEKRVGATVGDKAHPEAVLGMSYRSLFDTWMMGLIPTRPVVKGKPRDTMVVSAFQHSRTNDIVSDVFKLKTVSLDYTSDWNGLETGALEGVDPDTVVAVLVTHIFGRPLEFEAVLDWAEKHDVPVFEDCVQAGLVQQYKGNPRSTVCGWSTGMDKFPSCCAGGFLLTDGETAARMRQQIAAFKPESMGHWREKLIVTMVISFLFLYVSNTFMFLVEWWNKQSVQEATLLVRKSSPMFVHQRQKYLLKPHDRLAEAIADSCERAADQEIAAQASKNWKVFLEKFPELTPWEHIGEEPGFNPYTMVCTPSEDMDRTLFINALNHSGMYAMPAQTWVTADSAKGAPRAQAMLGRLVWLPVINFVQLTVGKDQWPDYCDRVAMTIKDPQRPAARRAGTYGELLSRFIFTPFGAVFVALGLFLLKAVFALL